MSAGTGVRHSEYNADPSGITHFLQIWIEPNIAASAPSYEQKHFPRRAETRVGCASSCLRTDATVRCR